MTIPEAVQLIIRSGSLASEARGRAGPLAGACVFVLEMGDPVKIVELARAMIELSGLDPDRDIDIEIVGARPGEKVHEALFNSYERQRPTGAEKIMLAEREPLAVAEVERMFREIILLVLEGDATGLAAKVAELAAELRGGGDEQATVAPGAAPAGEPAPIAAEPLTPAAAQPLTLAAADPATQPADEPAPPLPLPEPDGAGATPRIVAPSARADAVAAGSKPDGEPSLPGQDPQAGDREPVEDAPPAAGGAGAPTPLVHSPNS